MAWDVRLIGCSHVESNCELATWSAPTVQRFDRVTASLDHDARGLVPTGTPGGGIMTAVMADSVTGRIMVRARFAFASLCVVTACGNSAATTSTDDRRAATAAATSLAVATVAPYRIALARCLDAANIDLPRRAVDNAAALAAAREACDRASAELRTADLTPAIRPAVDALQREFVSLASALDRARLHVDDGDFEEPAQSELLAAVYEFQSAASQIL